MLAVTGTRELAQTRHRLLGLLRMTGERIACGCRAQGWNPAFSSRDARVRGGELCGADPLPDETERCKKRFRVGAPENPMSKYLNDLIASLEAEAKRHEAALAALTGQGFRRDSGYLDRLLQRIKTLEELRVSEAKRHRQLFRGPFANRRASSRHVSRAQGNASPQ
jgi:hypothetical protein